MGGEFAAPDFETVHVKVTISGSTIGLLKLLMAAAWSAFSSVTPSQHGLGLCCCAVVARRQRRKDPSTAAPKREQLQNVDSDFPPCGYSERMPASKKPCTFGDEQIENSARRHPRRSLSACLPHV